MGEHNVVLSWLRWDEAYPDATSAGITLCKASLYRKALKAAALAFTILEGDWQG